MATINSVPASDPVELVVYGREHCHLCHDMIAALQVLQARLSFRLEVVDVDSSADLRARYGERVPVLVSKGEEICHYHFDPVALARIFPQIAE